MCTKFKQFFRKLIVISVIPRFDKLLNYQDRGIASFRRVQDCTEYILQLFNLKTYIVGGTLKSSN